MTWRQAIWCLKYLELEGRVAIPPEPEEKRYLGQGGSPGAAAGMASPGMSDFQGNNILGIGSRATSIPREEMISLEVSR